MTALYSGDRAVTSSLVTANLCLYQCSATKDYDVTDFINIWIFDFLKCTYLISMCDTRRIRQPTAASSKTRCSLNKNPFPNY